MRGTHYSCIINIRRGPRVHATTRPECMLQREKDMGGTHHARQAQQRDPTRAKNALIQPPLQLRLHPPPAAALGGSERVDFVDAEQQAAPQGLQGIAHEGPHVGEGHAGP